MTFAPSVLPGLLLLAAQLLVLAAVGYVVVRVALRQRHDLSALAQGLVIGPALWGLLANFILYFIPGLAGAFDNLGRHPGLSRRPGPPRHEQAPGVSPHAGWLQPRHAWRLLGCPR